MDGETHTILQRALFVFILVAIFCSTFFVLWTLVSSQPFGHDEAVYLTKARSWMEGTPANQWGVYRPIGMSGIAWVLLQFGNSETYIRMFGVVAGALTIAVIFLFFRRVFNIWVGITVAGVVATSSLFLKEAPTFFNDVPSTSLLIATLWLLYVHYRTAGHSSSIYFVAIFAALAFYLRYGVVTTLIIILFFSYLVLLRRFVRKKDADFFPLVKTVFLGIALFIPHLIHSSVTTGSMWGILSLGGKAAGRAYLGEGLVTYMRWLPADIGGWMLGVAAIFGAVITVLVWCIPILRKRLFTLAWIGGIGLFTFITTGLLVHAEARYVFFPIVLLSGIGIAALYHLAGLGSRLFANVLMIVLLGASLYSGILHYRTTQSFFNEREGVAATIAYAEALEAVRADSDGKHSCTLWMALYLPRASWYTKCSMYRITDVSTFDANMEEQPGDVYYSLVYSRLTEPQITEKTAEQFDVTLTEIFRISSPTEGIRGDMIVYRIHKQ